MDDSRTITSEHEKVLLYLLDNKTINRSAAVKLLGVQKSKAYDILVELVSMDLIVPKGIGRGTHYILKKNDGDE